MYDILSDIISHEWVSNYSGDQQYLITCCCALILVLTVAIIDAIRTGFRAFSRK